MSFFMCCSGCCTSFIKNIGVMSKAYTKSAHIIDGEGIYNNVLFIKGGARGGVLCSGSLAIVLQVKVGFLQPTSK